MVFRKAEGMEKKGKTWQSHVPPLELARVPSPVMMCAYINGVSPRAWSFLIKGDERVSFSLRLVTFPVALVHNTEVFRYCI